MKTLLTLIFAAVICSCAASRDHTDSTEVHYLNSTKFVGAEAFCIVHNKRMSQAPEILGSGTDDLPINFLNLRETKFPNDGYFYPACTISTADNVWVCGSCSKASAKTKHELRIN
jgi:hypothetical protein